MRIMVFELIIASVHNPPYLDTEFTYVQIGKSIRYSSNTFIVVFMLIRVYLVLRLFTKFTKFRSNNAEIYCQREGIESDTFFALKCMMNDYPYSILLINGIFSTLIFAFAVRVFERPFYEDEVTGAMSINDPNYQDYGFITNTSWLIIVTITTVGFGDFFPKTHLGRMVTILASFYGVFLISLMVTTLTKSSEFTVGENTSYEILHRLKVMTNLKKMAAHVIVQHWKLYRTRQKLKVDAFNPVFRRDKIIIEENVYRREKLFQNERLHLKRKDVPHYEILRQLNERIDLDLDNVKTKFRTTKKIEE